MNRDEAQARWILARGWLDPALVTQVYHAPAHPSEDLCARLFARGLISAEQAAAARAYVGAALRDQGHTPPSTRFTASRRQQALRAPERAGKISSSIQPIASPPSQESSEISESFRAVLSSASSRVKAPESGRFGPYELLGEISRGGMGVVVKARDPAADRILAVKLLINQGGNDHAFERFKREARVLARLRHPNIIQVENYGRERGIPYYAMSYIEGETLAETVRRTRAKGRSIPEQTLIRWFLELADALNYCREMGVIHRDIKPSNLIIERESKRLVLIDFGLVKKDRSTGATTTTEGLTLELSKSGEVRGTPAFMAPEQIDSKSEFGAISEATDIWGFGATLYFCLTGAPPYDAETHANIYVAILTRDPPRARSKDRGVSKFFDKLSHDCLQRKGEKRPQTREVLERLEAARRDVSVPERRATGRSRRPSARRFRPLLAGAIALVATAIVLASWIAWRQAAAGRRARIAELRLSCEGQRAPLEALAQSGLEAARSVAGGAALTKDMEKGLEELASLKAKIAERHELGDPQAAEATAALERLSGRFSATLILASTEDLSRLDARRLSTLSAAIPKTAEDAFEVRWARARLALARGEDQTAVTGLKSLIRARPEVALYEDLAAAHRRAGRAREAAEVLDQGSRRLTAVADRARLILAGIDGTRDPGAIRRQLSELPEGGLGGPAQRKRASEVAWSVDAFDLFPRWMAWAQAEELRADDGQRVAYVLALLERDRPGRAAEILGPIDELELSPKQRALATWAMGRAALARFDFPLARSQLSLAAERAGTARLPVLRLRTLRRVIQMCGVDLNLEQASKLLGEATRLVTPSSALEERRVYARMLVDPANNAAVLMPLVTVAPEIATASPIPGARDIARAPPSLRFTSVVQSALGSRVFLKTRAADRLEAGMRLWFTPQPERANPIIERLGEKEAPDLLLRAARSWGVSRTIPGSIKNASALALFQKARLAPRDRLVERAQRFASGYLMLGTARLPEGIRRTVFRSLALALNEQPFDPFSHKLMALFAATEGGPSEGQARALGSAYLDPTDPDTLSLLAQLEPEPRRALTFLRFASLCDSPGLRDDRERLRLLRAVIALAAKLGDRVTMAEAARRALTIDPREDRSLAALIEARDPSAAAASAKLREIRERGLLALESAESALEAARLSEARAALDACRGSLPLLILPRWFRSRARCELLAGHESSQVELERAIEFSARGAEASITRCEDFFAAALGSGPAGALIEAIAAKTEARSDIDAPAFLLRAAALLRSVGHAPASGEALGQELYELDQRLKRAIALRPARPELRLALALTLLASGAPRDALDELGCLGLRCQQTPSEGGVLVHALRALASLRSGDRPQAIEALRRARELGFEREGWAALFQAEDFVALDRELG